MAETVIPVPKSILEKILVPINRITEGCILKLDKNQIYSICSSADNTVLLYARADLPATIEPSLRLNLNSTKKLLLGLECLGSDGIFSLKYDVNHIKCEMKQEETNEKSHFKYHLVDDSVLREAQVNLAKIAKLEFHTEFVLSPAKLRQLVAGYSFVSDLTKIYFRTESGKVYAEVDDKTLQNVDNITLVAASAYTGQELSSPLPVNMEVFKILTSSKSNVTVKINKDVKVLIFQSNEDGVELKYIISALVR